MRSLWIDIAALLLFWALIIAAVNPCGEFMVNDDWAFVKSLEVLRAEGRMPTTGWGPEHAPGGPSLIVHLLWGMVFTKAVGFSLTALRLSVLSLGILGSIATLVLLRLAGAPRWLAMVGALTLVLNPLYLALSFTFMTDVTFTTMAVVSGLFLWLGATRSNMGLIAVGFTFALVAVLVRQVGLVIPFGFVAACALHPDGARLGRLKVLVLAFVIVVVPWALYEAALAFAGSTPFTHHQIIHNIVREPLERGFPDYLAVLAGRVAHAALGYTCVLISPVVAVRLAEFLTARWFRGVVIVLTAGTVLLEAAILTGMIDPPVFLHRNVIFDFGLGPVLLKDTYILGITRTWTMPKWIFYLIAYWAVISMVVVAALSASCFKDLMGRGGKSSFLGSFALLCAIAYVGIIVLTGFHDRYLIPLCFFVVVWLVAEAPLEVRTFSATKLALAGVPLILMASFSVPALHDFMELKRSVAKANDTLLKEFKVDPCRSDGGFEFNGYHCYRPDFRSKDGLSWWWVSAEEYVVTLGPLPGFQVVRTFPFSRWLGPDGAVFILRPDIHASPPASKESGRGADGKTSSIEGGTGRQVPGNG